MTRPDHTDSFDRAPEQDEAGWAQERRYDVRRQTGGRFAVIDKHTGLPAATDAETSWSSTGRMPKTSPMC